MIEIKMILPFATFLLGVYLVPYIEKRKSKTKSKEIYSNLKLELNDEISELPKRLKNMALCLGNINHWEQEGEPKVGQPLYYIPRKTSCYFLKSSLENSFQLLTKEQRYAAKSLETQIDALIEYSIEIKEYKELKEEEILLLKNCYKRYLFTGSSTLNTMRILTNDPKGLVDKTDQDVINAIFIENGINLTAQDLSIVHKRIYNT